MVEKQMYSECIVNISGIFSFKQDTIVMLVLWFNFAHCYGCSEMW